MLVPRTATLLATVALLSCADPPSPQAPSQAATPAPIGVGDVAPPIQADFVVGEGSRSLEAATTDGRLVLLVLFGTYDASAAKAMRQFQTLLETFGSELAIIGVSHDEADGRGADFLREFSTLHGAEFPMFWDVGWRTHDSYRPTKDGIAYLIRDGRVRHIYPLHLGVNDVEPDIRALLR